MDREDEPRRLVLSSIHINRAVWALEAFLAVFLLLLAVGDPAYGVQVSESSGAEPLASSIVLNDYQDEVRIENPAEERAVGTFILSGTQRFDYAYKVLELVNQERANQNLSELVMDVELLDAAGVRSVECSYYFDHARPDGTPCFTVSSKMTAENIAAGQASPESVVASWMSSQGHRANILSPMARSVGISCFYQSGSFFWIMCFSTEEGSAAYQPANTDVTTRGAIDESLFESKDFRFGSLCYSLNIGERARVEMLFSNPGWSGHACKLDSESFVWRSEDPAVATVDGSGNLLGCRGGATKIIASIGTASLSVDVCVRLETPIVSARQSGSYAVVSWTKVPGAGLYQVFRGMSPDSAFQELVMTTSALSYRDATVGPRQTYYYSVRALYSEEAAWDCSSRHSDSCSLTLGEFSDPSSYVERLWGATALDTMQRISLKATAANSSSVAVVATMDGYWDALTATSIAGLNECPILLTEPNRLSAQAAGEIWRLDAEHVVISGGQGAVSQVVEDEIRAITGSVSRMAGSDAVGTALKTYEQGCGSWGETAIVATSATYHDALAASPYSYSKKAPIFLTDPSTKQLNFDTLRAIREGGFARVLICGGYAAVPQSVEASLSGLRIVRKGGATAYETSVEIANWCLSEGLKADGLGVATADGYWDALAGAAFCGSNESVLVLADDGNRIALDSFLSLHKANIEHAYVFGGKAAVSPETFDAVIEALR